MSGMGTVAQRIQQDVVDVHDAIERYLSEGIPEPEFKPFRVTRGIYGQRQKNVNMLRVKVLCGRINAMQLRCLAEVAAEYASGKAHVTTRQDFQLYYVSTTRVPDCLAILAETNLSTREAGGNVVRNVVADPYAGVDPEEAFDITPYAEAVAHHFLYNPISQRLPRKVKIAVSGSERDHACAAFNDIGLIAVNQTVNGIEERGFRVLVGGGLGLSPEAAHLLYEFIPTERLLPVLQAIVRVFDREGNRQNRSRARLKFVLRRVGVEQFRVWVDEMLEKLPTLIPIAYQESHPASAAGSWGSGRYIAVDSLWLRNHVKAQRQNGFVSVLVWLPYGDATPQQLHAVATAAQKWGNGEVRTTPAQNLLLRWVRREDLQALYDLLYATGLTQPCGGTIADVTSCPGSKTCQVGVTHSRALAQALMEELQGEEADEDLKGATIKISGCPHACSQHHVATVGFYGAAKKINGRAAPFYQLMIGGKVDATGVTFARPVMRVPARRVLQVVQRILGLFRGGREPSETLPQFLQRIEVDWLRDKLRDLADEETQPVGNFFFVDWGDYQPFALSACESNCTA